MVNSTGAVLDLCEKSMGLPHLLDYSRLYRLGEATFTLLASADYNIRQIQLRAAAIKNCC
ncbi:MAG: hypothetical protein NVSMB28_11740 [Collimonas sp.]